MIRVDRRMLLGCAGAAVFTGAAHAQSRASGRRTSGDQGEIVDYPSVNGARPRLRAFEGEKIILLISPERAVDRASIDRILGALGKAFDWCSATFARDPMVGRRHARSAVVVAEVQNAGFEEDALQIELAPDTMTRLLTEAKRDRYNQAAFFIMARLFWFCEPQLGKISAFPIGFAHASRFHAMEAAGITGAPWDENLDFDNYKRSVLVSVLDAYLADTNLTWKNTLGAAKGPPNPQSWGASELAAGFIHRIRRDHGNVGYRRFWRLMTDAPKADTAEEAAARFVQIARAATGADYRWLMRDQSLPTVY